MTVTGASGSIGSALCRRIAKQKPKLLVLLDQDESGIFDIYEELKETCRVDYVIASIRELDVLFEVFKKYKPEYVFHCAALKHVSLMERWPDEARKTNIDGLNNVIDAAKLGDVKKFVFISTDKAVNPSCVMGETKKEGEKICMEANEDVFGRKVEFMVVRFGNVLASAGSVVEIWRKQIEENKPITITDKRMKRYTMGIYDAVELILQVAQYGDGGCKYALDMGDQLPILELAKTMVKLSGKDIKIRYIGCKSGEKLSEELYDKNSEKLIWFRNGIFQICQKDNT